MSAQNNPDLAKFLDALGIRRPFVPNDGPFIPGDFWFTGTIPDNAVTDAIDFRQTESQLGWNPTAEDNPDYTLIIDRINVLAFPAVAEQSPIDGLLASCAVVWSPSKDTDRFFNTGHASGYGVGDTGTTTAATTTRISKLRDMGSFIPLDKRGSLRINLRNQGLTFRPVIAVNVGAAVPVVVGIRGAYIRNDDFASYGGPEACDCKLNDADPYAAGYNAGQSIHMVRY